MRIALCALWYPMCIARYFLDAFKDSANEIVTAGPAYGTWIPWQPGGLHLPEKYAIHVDYPYPQQGATALDGREVKSRTGADLVISIDAGLFMLNADVVVATDPHVFQYTEERASCRYFFNMQRCYSQPGDYWLPYAYNFKDHFSLKEKAEWEYDVACIGLPYQQRNDFCRKVREYGFRVRDGIGFGPDEYRDIYQKSRCSFVHSSQNDTIARVFESAAMGVPMIANLTPDIGEFFRPEEHFLPFDSGDLETAFEHFQFIVHNPQAAEEMAFGAQCIVKGIHTYHERRNSILRVVSKDLPADQFNAEMLETVNLARDRY